MLLFWFARRHVLSGVTTCKPLRMQHTSGIILPISKKKKKKKKKDLATLQKYKFGASDRMRWNNCCFGMKICYDNCKVFITCEDALPTLLRLPKFWSLIYAIDLITNKILTITAQSIPISWYILAILSSEITIHRPMDKPRDFEKNFKINLTHLPQKPFETKFMKENVKTQT